MATEAEAAREARAKVIAAEGEQNASTALKKAAQVISESPIAIQLRYLQTLTQIASEKNSTIVFPIPLEMLSFLSNKSANVFNRNNNININDKNNGATTTAKIANEVQEQATIKHMVEKFWWSFEFNKKKNKLFVRFNFFVIWHFQCSWVYFQQLFLFLFNVTFWDCFEKMYWNKSLGEKS